MRDGRADRRLGYEEQEERMRRRRVQRQTLQRPQRSRRGQARTASTSPTRPSDPKPMPQDKLGVYYVNAKGQVTRIIDNLPNPNGILLSVDGKTLYVIPTSQAEMMAYPIEGRQDRQGNGVLHAETSRRQEGGRRRRRGRSTSKGNLYITSAIGLQVSIRRQTPRQHRPARTARQSLLRRPRSKTLYVCARTSLYTVQTEATGHLFAVKK